MSITYAMSCKPFEGLAEVYDAIHAAKDYDYLAKLILKLSGSTDHRFFEWGCGTGNLLAALQRHGCTKVVGCDRSSAMLAKAQEKGVGAFYGDMLEPASFYPKPDAETHISVFGVPSYAFSHISTLRINYFFRDLKNYVRKNFIFEVVNYSGCVTSLRTRQEQFFPLADCAGEVSRVSLKQFDAATSQLTIRNTYQIAGLKAFNETHSLRAFTPQEIRGLLELAGWRVEAMFDPESGSMRESSITDRSYYFMVSAVPVRGSDAN